MPISQEEIDDFDRYLQARDGNRVVEALADVHELMVHVSYRHADGRVEWVSEEDKILVSELVEKYVDKYHGGLKDATEHIP